MQSSCVWRKFVRQRHALVGVVGTRRWGMPHAESRCGGEDADANPAQKPVHRLPLAPTATASAVAVALGVAVDGFLGFVVLQCWSSAVDGLAAWEGLVETRQFLASAARSRIAPTSTIHTAPSWVREMFAALDLLMRWIAAHPAGFSFTAPLSGVFADTFMYFARIWCIYFSVVVVAAQNLVLIPPHVVAACALVLGLSGLLALASDMLRFVASWHLRLFYQLFRRLYRGQLLMIRSLLLHFMGWKHNPLRDRLDTSDFSRIQHAVSSVLLIALCLCLPPVATFYFVFSVMHMVLGAAEALNAKASELLQGTLMQQRRESQLLVSAGVRAGQPAIQPTPLHGHHEDCGKRRSERARHTLHSPDRRAASAIPSALAPPQEYVFNIVFTDTIFPRLPPWLSHVLAVLGTELRCLLLGERSSHYF